LEATAHNLVRFEEIKKVEAKHLAKHREEAKVIADKIEKISCTLKVKAGEADKLFGSVTSQDIQDVLQKEGLEIDKKLKEEGLSILLVEQNAALALKLVDYVHVLSKGRVVYSADPQVLWANEQVKAGYLGI